MKRFVLTTDSSAAGGIGAAGLADFVIVLERRLVWGFRFLKRNPTRTSRRERRRKWGRTGRIIRPCIGSNDPMEKLSD